MAFYGANDIKKLVTMEIIRFIMQNQDYVLNNTSYGSDLSYEVGCQSLNGKNEAYSYNHINIKLVTRYFADGD